MAEQYTRQVNIYVDSGQAVSAYETLIKKNEQLSKSEENAQKKLEQLQSELAKTSDKGTIDKLNKDIAATENTIKKLSTAQKENAESIDRLGKKISGELSPSYRDLTATAQKLTRELKNMSEQDPGFQKKKEQVIAANKAVTDYQVSMGKLTSRFRDFMTESAKIATGVIIGNTIQAAIDWGISSITSAIQNQKELARELTNIAKVTNLTDSAVKELNADLREMDTATSNKRLRELAVDAGKLGIEGAENIKKFVREADMINVALGEDLGVNAVSDIQKLSNVFETSMEKIGSALNDIEQKSAASATYQVDFMSRMAGVSQTTNLAADSILGYGSALEITKQPIEASSTALNTFFIDFVRETEKFGNAAGFARGELSKLLSEKGTNEAFLTFLEKIKEGSKTSADMLLKLKEMGIDGARGASTFLTLANNIQLVREQQLIANSAITDGTSLSKEYNRVNNDLSSQLDKLSKKIAGWFAPLGSSIASMLSKFTELGKSSLDVYKEQDSKVKSTTQSITSLLSKYDELKNKASLSKEEQDSLRKTISSIAELVPSAVTAFDKYGNAIDISRTKVQNFKTIELAKLEQMRQSQIAITESKLEDSEKKIDMLQAQLNRALKDNNILWNLTDKNKFLDKTQKELQATLEKVNELKSTLASLRGLKIAAPGEQQSASKNPVIDPNNLDSSDEEQKKISRAARAAQAADEARKRELEKQRDFIRKIEELTEQHDAAMQSDDERELARIEIKYKRLRAELDKVFPEMTAQVRELREQLALLEGDETFTAQSKIEYAATLKTLEDSFNRAKIEVKNDYAAGLINQKTYNATMAELDYNLLLSKIETAGQYVESVKTAQDDITQWEKQAADMRVANAQREADDKVKAANDAKDRMRERDLADLEDKARDARKTYGLGDDEQTQQDLLEAQYEVQRDAAIKAGEDTLALEREFADAKDAIDEEYTRKKLGRVSMWFNTAAGIGSQFLSAWDASERAAEERELKRVQQVNNEKKNQYKKQLDQKLISQKQYDELVLKADQEADQKAQQIKLQQFQRDKQMKMITAGMNIAAGVLATFAQLGWPAGIAPAAALSAAGAVELAIISASNPPEMEDGGIIEDGSTHEQGGMDVIDRRTGRPVANIERGELLLSRRFRAANAPLVPLLLEASKTGASLLDGLGSTAPRINSSRAVKSLANERSEGVAADTSVNKAATSPTTGASSPVLEEIRDILKSMQSEGFIDYDKLGRSAVDITEAMKLEL